jgi:ribosomal protein S12 methylthiotransferase accessory factor
MAQEMTVTLAGGKRVNVRYDGFEIATDQSRDNGGEASAPEPFDLFLASLATCAGAYVAGFCGKRDIPTDGIRLVQRWERDAEGRLVTIRLEVQVPPSFPQRYRDAVVRAAELCAVKRVLERPPTMEVRAVQLTAQG